MELHPARIIVTPIERGWKPRRGASLPIAVDAEASASNWRAPLSTLKTWLADQPRANVELVVSDCYARYQLVPWHSEVKTTAEISALGRACFADVYGSAADNWEIQTDLSGYGIPGVACAIDQALLKELRDIFTEGGMRLDSVRPMFMGMFNRYRKRLGAHALLASIDESRCVLACIKDGKWHSIRSLPCMDMDTVLEREILLQGLPHDAVRFVTISGKEHDTCAS
ncbi:hypothetical protein [Duganella radicis]|uniref:Uncharacterized protein n=1 Tax=Duganella radicis TaxID=551988 RepID=A0A6L6PN50_9BURK|nr:hypothetical protein [Duganella radicis]MTV40556.1 hypothetical protein [Duganella radicis]